MSSWNWADRYLLMFVENIDNRINKDWIMYQLKELTSEMRVLVSHTSTRFIIDCLGCNLFFIVPYINVRYLVVR